MSTKCSLAWGEKFHTYTDCLDDHPFVYVQLDGAEFQVSPGSATIQIPLPIWEYIRTYSPARYNLVHLSDSKLKLLARKRAAERKKMLQKTNPNSPVGALLAFRQPVGVRKILRHLKAERKAQQNLRAEVEQLQKDEDNKTKIPRRP